MTMKRLSIICLILLAGLLPAQNLILNPEFDRPVSEECSLDCNPGVLKMTQFTEDLTWNKCLRLDVVKYHQKDGKENYYALVLIGGKPNKYGFAVKPNTVYKFSLEIKGTLDSKNANIHAYEFTGDNFWKDRRKLKLEGDLKIKASKDDWTVYSGSFQTGADAKTAMVGIGLWGEARYNNLPPVGGYIMIDKVKVEEHANLLGGPAVSAEPVVAERKILMAGTDGRGFVDYKSGSPAKADTAIKVNAGEDALEITVRCLEPEMAKVKAAVKADGAKVWEDDAVEIFFEPVTPDRGLTQLVVAAGGGRWMGFGNGEVKHYDQWSAEVTKGNDYWEVKAKVPYSLIGWKSKPADGEMAAFNICRQRKEAKEFSSWSFARGSFHDIRNFGVLIFGSPEAWRDRMADQLSGEGPSAELAKEIQAWKALPVKDLSKSLAAAETLRQRINLAKLGERVAVLTAVSPTLDPTLPILPAELVNPPAKISIRAAGNEFKPLPLAVTNLTAGVEEYRLSIGTLAKNGGETPGLQGNNGKIFPAERIQLLRGIRVKDGEDEKHGLRIDPLTVMDAAGTLVVPPRESGLAWAVFDTAGVEPGVYSGNIRLTPLGEALTEYDWGKLAAKGKFQDIPFSLEVLPFELDKKPAVPFFMFQRALNEAFFKAMADYGVHVFQVNPWGIAAAFNADGSLASSDTAKVEAHVAQLREWAGKYGIGDTMRISICYGAYVIFRDVHSKKRFETGSPEWKRALGAYTKLLSDTMTRCGIPAERYDVEVWDEPAAKNQDELLAACQVMHEAVPAMDLQLVFAAWALPVPYLEKLVPYVKTWTFWNERFIGNAEYKDFIEELRKKDKILSFYNCETTMRLDLYRYYRRHAWFGLANNLDMISMYQLIDAPHSNYGLSNWRGATRGGVMYSATGQPVSSVRMECLRIGITDVKYMKKLADVLAANPNHPAAAEARKFLGEAPLDVVRNSHDQSRAGKVREEAIALILKLSGK